MRRRTVVALAVAVAGATVAVPAVALAYHNGKVYDLAPGAGGAGGLYYTGSPRERGWDCTVCHIDPPGRLKLDVSSQPPELLDQLRYQPGTTYALTVAMANPMGQLGLASTRSNYNAMVVSVDDAQGTGIGMISGFDPGRFYARGSSILASDSTIINETSWTFSWTAPATGSGPITIHLVVVDGNAAGQTAVTLTDPLGDDVAVLAYTVTDAVAARAMTWATSGLGALILRLPVLLRTTRMLVDRTF